jgi:ATP-binding cassette, subfamily F, member 3
MAFVQFSGLSLAFGDRDILKNISLRLAAGTRACLTGANGCGKSTLIKIIAGSMKADSGDRAVQKGTRISCLPQSGIVHKGSSLRDEAETAFSFAHNLLERLEETGRLLESSKDGDSSTQSLIEEHHNLQEQIENSGYYRREAAVSSVLTGLGFSVSDLNRGTQEFSGGWQMRIALAKVLLEQPDILLLDEPTNYLDIEARTWLEKWLESFPGGYLLVSHDRYFLDVCVNEVYELFQGNLKRYAGNYTAYEKVRKVELASLVKRYEEQQEEIIKTEALIRRFRYKATKAAFAQELIKRLDKMERIDIPESLKKINITFPPPPHSGNIALTLESVGKSYGEHRVLSGVELCLEAGERLVVAGPNGAGKSTLLRIIAGQDKDFEGNVKYGSGIRAGYFSQTEAEEPTAPASNLADAQNTQVLDFMEAGAPTSLIPKLRDMLGAFLFRGDDVYKSISVLSGGERSRLALLKMLLKPLNLLILDEPTNHLDLNSKDILLDALSNFGGTIIFVSHDRSFMEALSTKTLELASGNPPRARLFYGNYAYYLDRIAVETEGAVPKPAAKTARADKTAEPQLTSADRRAADKQRQAIVRRLERQEAELLKTLEELEKTKAALEAELSLPEVYSNGQRAKEVKNKLDDCTAAIEVKTAEWEKAASALANSPA